MTDDTTTDAIENNNDQSETKYASFWIRGTAQLIDALIWSVLTLGLMCIPIFENQAVYITFYVLNFFAAIVYNIYFNTKFGATIGKMICEIKIVNLEKGAINLTQAIYRYIIEILFQIISFSVFMNYLLTYYDELNGLNLVERVLKMYELGFLNDDIISSNLSSIYCIIAVIVLFSNKRRRTIHDYIAKTMVIHKPKK